MSGPPVTVVASGGMPVRQVESGAPVLTAVESGGAPITLSDHGVPYVVEGLSIIAGFAGSAQFPFENGWTSNAATDGQILVNGFRTAATGTGTDSDLWRTPSSIVAICDPARSRTDAQNFSPCIFGTNIANANRVLNLRYWPGRHFTTGNRRMFSLYIRGETTPGAWQINSAAIPASAKGPFAVFPHYDGTNGYLHVLDIPTGTWLDGPAVAKPASWIGVSTVALTKDLVIGGHGNYTFPADNSANRQLAANWRGAIGQILFANAVLSKADVEAIVNGADAVATATGAGATIYTHIPMTDGAGNLSAAVNSTFPGLSLTHEGTVLDGPTLARQSAAKYLTVDPLPWPAHFGVEAGANAGVRQMSGTMGGVSGDLQVAWVHPDGSSARGWKTTPHTAGGGAWSAEVDCPATLEGDLQPLFRFSGDPDVIAAGHAECQVGPVIDVFSQSEGVMSTNYNFSANGVPGALAIPSVGGTKNVVFARFTDPATSDYALANAENAPGFIGDPGMALANGWRRRTSQSVLFRLHTINGTSMLALMNDADTSRKWSDVVGMAELSGPKNADGKYISTGVVIVGWEAFSGPTDVIASAYVPFLTGTPSSDISAGDLDHWLGDGTFTTSHTVTILPANRNSLDAASAGVSDGSTEADQRDLFRNYAHTLGYIVGPENIAHKLQGENTAGGLPATGATHPEPADYEGTIEMAQNNAEAALLSLGLGSYKGPVFFENVRAGSAANKVIVKLGPHRPTPGDGLAAGSTGYNTGAQANTAPFTDSLYVKKSGGDAGAGFEANIDGGGWSKANVTSGTIIADDEVELTLSSVYSTVSLRYAPGTNGSYSSATITQEAYRSGLLHYGGTGFLAGSPQNTGFAVAGSNQALVL